MEQEGLDKLLSSKRRIESRISELEEELEDLREVLRVLDLHLDSRSQIEGVKLGTEVADEAPRPEIPTVPEVYEQIVPLKAADGTMLASLFIGRKELKVVPGEGLKFRVSVPPFQQFLINKVLANMTAKDRDDAVAGSMSPEEMLTYRVHQDGDVLKELVIRNFRDTKRVGTLRNSIRWTLEKMHEKRKL